MKNIRGWVGIGWLFFIAMSACTVGGDRSKIASLGESCASKQCGAPASCLATNDGPRCLIVCVGGSKSNCPRNMICAITPEVPQTVCVRDPDASTRWMNGY